MTIEELRREVREQWDKNWALIKALRGLPEIPPVGVMLMLSQASSSWSRDSAIGKRIQREQRNAVPYKSECEQGMGFYYRLRQGLLASRDEAGSEQP